MVDRCASGANYSDKASFAKGDSSYNPWPLGKLSEMQRRPELAQLATIGISVNDPRQAVSEFESRVAAYAGSRFAVAVDCCSHGLFLCLKYRKIREQISIPRRTYVSVPMQVAYATRRIPIGEDVEWSGLYELGSTGIIDSAARYSENMFLGGDYLQVLSFQIKKRLPIGRGGAILTNSPAARDWLKLASYDGRDLSTPYDHPDHVQFWSSFLYDSRGCGARAFADAKHPGRIPGYYECL